MAKRLPGAVRFVVTREVFTHDGEKDVPIVEPTGALTNSFLAYLGDLYAVQFALYDFVLANTETVPALSKARGDGTEIKLLLIRLFGDDVFGPTKLDLGQKWGLLRSIDRLSERDLLDILTYVTDLRWDFGSHSAQWTFPEARETCMAVAQKPAYNDSQWLPLDGEVGLRFVRHNSTLEIKFSPTALLSIPKENPIPTLKTVLNASSQRAVICFQLVLDAVIRSSETSVRIRLDDIIRTLGMEIRNSQERIEARRLVWTWIRIFDAMQVVGTRRGFYSGQRLRIDDALVHIRAFVGVNDDWGIPSDAPWEVELEPGMWVKEHRSNRRILSHLGNLMPIATIPSGRPGGAWAQSIGLALNQRWREKGRPKRVGEDLEAGKKREVVDFSATRLDLLSIFPPEPTLQQIRTDHPKRALEYWDEAISLLKKNRIISFARDEGSPTHRQGWFDAWVHQEIQVRPTRETTQDLVSITAQRKKKRSSKRHNRAMNPSSGQ